MENNDKKQSVIARAYNRIYTTTLQKLNEREFTAENGQTIRYMYFPTNSDILVIGFQACNDHGARYNYVRTLRSCNVNCLFIKDDFGSDGRGDFYLGCNGTSSVEKAVFELIDRYIRKLHPGKVLYIGSSKGGYAALNFGLQSPQAIIIAAAPQYLLGSLLNGDEHRSTMKEVVGHEIKPIDIDQLDHKLQNIIQNDPYAKEQKIYLQYSTEEHTYKEHIQYLLADLHKKGIAVEEDIKDYKEHGDLKYYFPQYLAKIVNNQ